MGFRVLGLGFWVSALITLRERLWVYIRGLHRFLLGIRLTGSWLLFCRRSLKKTHPLEGSELEQFVMISRPAPLQARKCYNNQKTLVKIPNPKLCPHAPTIVLKLQYRGLTAYEQKMMRCFDLVFSLGVSGLGYVYWGIEGFRGLRMCRHKGRWYLQVVYQAGQAKVWVLLATYEEAP